MSLYSGEARISSPRVGVEDDRAFADLVGPLRGPLLAHCYRMLGSVQDAEDALQEALLRAWRALPSFDTTRPIRPWLYRIATNVCLDALARRPRRGLPTDRGSAAAPGAGAGDPVLEPVWLEPLADPHLEDAVDPDARDTPHTRYEQRETLELAFLAALQHLPPRQRAALLLCDVLAFTAAEAARALQTTPASITSALQRSRATLERRGPAVSQRRILAELGDGATAQLVRAYVDALQAGDVARLTGLLAEDVRFSMPPFAVWWQGRGTVLAFVAADDASRRFLPLRLNGQPALAAYRLDPATQRHSPEVLEVLTLDERRRISDLTLWVDPSGPCAGEASGRAAPVASLFARAGLPPALGPGAR